MAMRRWDGRFPAEMDDGRYCTFYYQIQRSLNYNRGRIEEAMDEIESHSRIRFEPRRNQRCYLTLTKSDGCWTNGTGDDCRPRISLGMGCTDFGIILHELLHAIGFEHEHNRPDRGDYVIINWRNIEDGEENQFKKLRRNQYEWMDFEIDFESIMMYDSYAFSRNGEMTIQARDGEEIEENEELSDMDIEKLRLL
ncbi:Zinc metalloproteinase nas-6 like protein [Argiope bruennichi]|uniref:Metalloendopeptidase n=1 Tax=Argiope bruennichi TaxID=94029 RepID=A0A8T0E5D4_ARGBR|nr:Zinc metalloproteinase nas-6 like protein [Argiope bruennichi]